MQIKRAVRHAVPMIMGIAGVSGSGKTFSALLLAAGLAGKDGKIGFLDTEQGRGSIYSDDPGIMAAMPQGYGIIELSPPFHPKRYMEAIDAFENNGYTVCVIDSGSHAWEGEGGCTDIAEENKGRWNQAKLWNKRFVNRLLSSRMHIIVCLRAREKSKIIPATATTKEQIISLGILPVCEKSLPFELMLSFRVDEETHLATPIKCPAPLMPLFPKPLLLTKESGERILAWNQTGAASDSHEPLRKRARAAAEQGTEHYAGFFKALSKEDRKVLADCHTENKKLASEADAATAIPVFGSKDNVAEWPDSFDGTELIWNGVHLKYDEGRGNYVKAEIGGAQ